MKTVLQMLGILILGTTFNISAQVVSQPSPTATADTAWQTLTSLTSTATAPAGGKALTLAQEITNLQQEAQQANSFYTAFPGDVRAKTAKKFEAVADLQEAELGVSSYQSTALAVAAAFVKDTTQAIQDRFDIALAAALVWQAPTLQGQGPLINGSAYEAIADSLYGQFGDVAPAYSYYLSLTMTADNATAAKIAAQIQTMSAPSWAKQQAQIVLNRAALVGTAVNLTLTSSSNQSINLSQASGQVTVVYLWNGSTSTNDLTLLSSLQSQVPASVQWIYVALYSPSPSLAAAQAAAPFPGTQCFDPVNLAGWVPQTLFLQVTPYAYVFNSNGTLSGYGPPSLIPALVSAASN